MEDARNQDTSGMALNLFYMEGMAQQTCNTTIIHRLSSNLQSHTKGGNTSLRNLCQLCNG